MLYSLEVATASGSVATSVCVEKRGEAQEALGDLGCAHYANARESYRDAAQREEFARCDAGLGLRSDRGLHQGANVSSPVIHHRHGCRHGFVGATSPCCGVNAMSHGLVAWVYCRASCCARFACVPCANRSCFCALSRRHCVQLCPVCEHVVRRRKLNASDGPHLESAAGHVGRDCACCARRRTADQSTQGAAAASPSDRRCHG